MNRGTRIALLLMSAFTLVGCGSTLFEQDEPWRVGEAQLRNIAAGNLAETAEKRPLPTAEMIDEVLDGAIDWPEPEERVALTLADVRLAALENNLELAASIVNPAIAEAGYDAEAARFESVFVASVSEAQNTQQITNLDQSSNSSTTSVSLGIDIPLQTGGTLSFSAPFSRNEQDSTFAEFDAYWSAGVQFSLSQPLLRNAGLRVNTAPIRVAAYRSQIAQAQTKLAAIRILGNAEKAYWRLYRAWQELDVRQQQYDLAIEQRDRAQRMVDAGQAAEIEVIRAESGIGASLEVIIRANGAIKRAQRELKQFINREDLPVGGDTAIETASIPNPIGLIVNAEDMATKAVANRMEMLELDLQLAIDASDVEVARNATLPDIAVQYAFGLRSNQPGSLANAYEEAFNGFYDSWSVGFSASVPIGNEQARARLHQAVLQRVQRLATREQREQSIRREVYDVVDALDETWQRILAARLETVLAGRTFEAERRQFDLGVRTSHDVLDASARLADARSSEIAAVVEYQAALIDAAFATGTLFGSSQIQWVNDDDFAGGYYESTSP